MPGRVVQVLELPTAIVQNCRRMLPESKDTKLCRLQQLPCWSAVLIAECWKGLYFAFAASNITLPSTNGTFVKKDREASCCKRSWNDSVARP